MLEEAAITTAPKLAGGSKPRRFPPLGFSPSVGETKMVIPSSFHRTAHIEFPERAPGRSEVGSSVGVQPREFAPGLQKEFGPRRGFYNSVALPERSGLLPSLSAAGHQESGWGAPMQPGHRGLTHELDRPLTDTDVAGPNAPARPSCLCSGPPSPVPRATPPLEEPLWLYGPRSFLPLPGQAPPSPCGLPEGAGPARAT